MIGYFACGAFRTIFGILSLTFLVHIHTPLTAALLIVISIDCSLYVLQVKLSIGDIKIKTILMVFTCMFVFNRAMLWLFHEQLDLEIYLAQSISIITVITLSFLYLKSKKLEAISTDELQ